MLCAHIVPPNWVKVFRMSNYYMGLAHWIPKYDNYAMNLMQYRGYLIMDNGAFENEQQNNPMLKLSSIRVEADEVVLPDEPGDGKKTIRKSWSAYTNFFNENRVMFVPQGNTPREWKDCLDSWIENWKSKTDDSYLSIGVSSLRTTEGAPKPGSKTETLAHALEYKYPVHILGLADVQYFTSELLGMTNKVRGMDTSTAFALGARDVLLTPEAEKVRLGDPEQYKSLSILQRRLIKTNQAILTYWCKTKDANNGIPERVVRSVVREWEKYWARGFKPLREVLRSAGFPYGKYEVFFDDDPSGIQQRYIRVAELGGYEIDVRDYT